VLKRELNCLTNTQLKKRIIATNAHIERCVMAKDEHLAAYKREEPSTERNVKIDMEMKRIKHQHQNNEMQRINIDNGNEKTFTSNR